MACAARRASLLPSVVMALLAGCLVACSDAADVSETPAGTSAGDGPATSGPDENSACSNPETADAACFAEGLRGADDCPGPTLDPSGDGELFCLPVPPAPPEAPAATTPAFRQPDGVRGPCPDEAGGRCDRAVPCSPGSDRFPDEAALRAFFDAPASVAVRYVDPDAAADGDGTRISPWQELAPHVGRLPHRAIVAIAPGTVAGAVRIDRTVRIVGACDGTTVLTDSDPEGFLVTVAADNVELVSLTLEPGTHGILASRVQGVVLQRMDIRDTTGRGVNAEHGATLWMEDVRIAARPGSRRAVGLFSHGATVDGQRVDIEGWWQAAINAQATARVTLRDLTIDGTAEAAVDMYGVRLSREARVVVERVRAVHAGSAFGVIDGSAEGAEPRLEVRDLSLESLAPTGAGAGWRRHGFIVVGRGGLVLERARAAPLQALFLTLEDDARATLRDVALEAIDGFSADRSFNVPFQLLDRSHLDAARVHVGAAEVYALGLQHGASAAISDLRVDGVMPDSEGVGPGRVITLAGTGVFSLHRADLRFGGDNGMVLTGPEIVLEDVALRPAELREQGRAQRGFIVQDAGQVSLRRVHTEASSAGMAFMDIPGRVIAEDLIVQAHHPTEGSSEGYNVGGLRLESVDDFAFTRIALIDNAWPAAQAGLSDGAFRDVWIGSHAPGEPSGARGLIVHDGSVTVERLSARDVHGYALLAYGAAGEVEARDVVVLGSRVGQCAHAACNVDGCAVSVEGGSVDMARFWLEDADLGALCLRDRGNIRARSGMVVRNRNGVVLDGASVDLDRDFEDVVLLDNARGVVSDQPARTGTPDLSALAP